MSIGDEGRRRSGFAFFGRTEERPGVHGNAAHVGEGAGHTALGRNLAEVGKQEALQLIISALYGEFGQSLGLRNVWEVRDHFAEIMGGVREGQPQLIGVDEADRVIMISDNNLADFVLDVVKDQSTVRDQSFIESLYSLPGFDREISTRVVFEERDRSQEWEII